MITIIGSINLDLIARVERLPAPGETVPGHGFSTAPGGKGANQALAARRAGAAVRMVGAVGKDAFAAEALSLLADAGVDLAYVKETAAPTGTAMILVGGDGENMIAVVPGANGEVSPQDAEAAGLREGGFVLLQHEIPLSTVEAALNAARSAGAVSLLNTAPFHAEAAGFLVLADYVIANETEFDLYATELALEGANREDKMRAFAHRTGRRLVVTLGAKGVLAATKQGLLHVPAPSITPVDTVGAGDTFCGYLAAGLAEGLELEAALRQAAVAGALACLKPGAQPAIPLRVEVDELMVRL
ncbi:ribokinase [Chelativorans sp. SCAU2101]|uniref:Ribokinase n=1 Tax=Chelativorans petroleitrophicus TaxID=2975484 RepID=A0A9X2X6X5_9HYPH|nr:ribokinase [Chelativorans petroleitrophicus]